MTTITVEGVDVDTRHWIGGQRVASTATFTDISPIDETVLGEISAGGADEVDAAVAAARAAFPAWAAMAPADRAAILRRVADGIDARAEDLAQVETRDNGSLLRSHRRGVMPRVGMNFRFFADYSEQLAHPDREIRGHRERITYDPAGVTAIITPWIIAAAAAPNIVPLSFELGGKSPLLIFDDSDLDLAVNLAVEQFDNAGQVCLGAFRMLVQEGVADEFLARVVDRARTLVQGDPRDEETDVSALVSRAHFDRVSGFVERAIADGAKPVLGGGPNADLGGLYFSPTILVGADPDAEITKEEVFGPVLTLQTFADEDEGVRMANDTPFGLAATVVTGDSDRAERVSARLRAGTVWVNCFFVRDLGAPFGGSGHSGIGREGGTWSFDFYCDVKNSVFSPTGWTDAHDTSREARNG
jgi:acyl-CoA reductase-like NAD-dependent aldehyde dehydrogenase